MDIVTNGHARELLSLAELPGSDAAEFDYVRGDDCFYPRFVKFLGSWIDVNDMDGLAHSVGITGWDMYASDSYFSGIVVRYVRDDAPFSDLLSDSVIVGRFYT